MKRGALWLGVMATLVVAACGHSAPTSPEAHHRLTGRVLTEIIGGGYVPADVAFAQQLPVVAVFADGRVFSVDEASSVNLGSRAALVTVVERTLSPSALDRIVNLAQAAGVTPHPPQLGRPTATDLATTTVTVTADGRTSTIAVYGLGFKDGLSSDEVAARHRLQAFSDALARIGAGAGPGTRPRAYAPQSFSVYAEALDSPTTPVERPRRWPLGSFPPTAPASFECVPAAGDAAAKRIIHLAATSTSDTVWTSAGRRWQVVFRPDLPGTKPCE